MSCFLWRLLKINCTIPPSTYLCQVKIIFMSLTRMLLLHFTRQASQVSSLKKYHSAHDAFSSFKISSNNLDSASSSSVGCTAVAAKENCPQTALWQQKPDLPLPCSLIISTKINADEGHFGKGKGRRAFTESIRSQMSGSSRRVYIRFTHVCVSLCSQHLCT